MAAALLKNRERKHGMRTVDCSAGCNHSNCKCVAVLKSNGTAISAMPSPGCNSGKPEDGKPVT